MAPVTLPLLFVPELQLGGVARARCTAAALPGSICISKTGRCHMLYVTLAGDAEIEEAVASRLYRAELARAEAQAKLGEW